MKFNLVVNRCFPWIIKIGLFSTAFISLIIFRTLFFPYITSKAFVFQLLVEILFIFYIVLILYSPQFRPRFNKLSISIFVFVGVFLLSAVFGQDLIRSFWSTQSVMTGVFMWLHCGLFFLMLQSMLQNKKDWIWFLRFQVIGAMLACSTVIFSNNKFIQKIFFTSSYYGTFGNPNYLGAYLVFFIFLIPILIVLEKSILSSSRFKLWLWRSFYAGVIVLNIITLLATGNRGAIFGVLVGLFLFFILCLIFYPKKRTLAYRLILWVYVFFLALVFTMIFWVISPNYAPALIQHQTFYGRIRAISFDTSRIGIWRIGLKAWKEKPILGFGPENFVLAYEKYFSANDFPTPYYGNQKAVQAHNIFIEILTTSGILGILAYLVIFIISFVKLFQHRKKDIIMSFLLISLLTAYFFQNLFGFDTPSSLVLFFISLSLVNFTFFEAKKGTVFLLQVRKFLDQPQYKPAIILICWLGILVSIYYINVRSLQASHYTAIARNWEYDNSLSDTKVLQAYQAALNRNGVYSFEIKQYAAQYFSPIAQNRKLDQDVFNKLLWLSQQMEEDVEKRPNDPWGHFWLAQIYLLMGTADKQFLDKALTTSQRGVALAPQNYRFYYDLGSIYLALHDCEKAQESWSRALELGEAESKIKWSNGVCKVGEGKFEEGLSLLEEGTSLGYSPYSRLFDVVLLAKTYGQLNKLDKALEYYLAAVSKDSENVDLLIALASLYKELDDIENARTTAKKILEIDVKLTSEVDAFLKTLEK